MGTHRPLATKSGLLARRGHESSGSHSGAYRGSPRCTSRPVPPRREGRERTGQWVEERVRDFFVRSKKALTEHSGVYVSGPGGRYDMTAVCPCCEQQAEVRRVRREEVVNVRGEAIPVEAEYYVCESCGGTFENTRGPDSLEAAYREYRRRHSIRGHDLYPRSRRGS